MKDMADSDPIVICGAARTPLGAFQGAFSEVSATELGAVAIEAALKDAGVAVENVDEVLMGNVLPAGLGQAPARQAALAAGLRPPVGAGAHGPGAGPGAPPLRARAARRPDRRPLGVGASGRTCAQRRSGWG